MSSHQQGIAVHSRSLPGVKTRKPKPLLSRSYFPKNVDGRPKLRLRPKPSKHVLKQIFFVQGVVDSAGPAFLVWDGFSGAQDTTLLEHGRRSAS